MRETDFIEQNKDKWIEFEELYKAGNTEPEKLSNLFVQITDDLAYARTHYPNRAVRVYLNNLAQNVLFNLQTKRPTKKNFIVEFYKEELPYIVYQCRKQLLFTLSFFLLCVIIGALTSHYNKDFAAEILGYEYLQTTDENIAKGDPMAIYKSQTQTPMFIVIAKNNIEVAVVTFISGLLIGLGSIYFLFTNGIMVGVFQFYFIQKGLLVSSLLSIWLHGTLEISCIILAGGAGIVMGQGIVFPGTLSRMQSLILSSRQGLKLLLGIIPIIIFAAFIESFLTRYTFAPAILKASLIFISLLFILLYFVYYPYTKNKNKETLPIDEYKLNPSEKAEFNLTQIYSVTEILKFAFYFFKENFLKVFKFLLPFSIVMSLVLFYYFKSSLFSRINATGIQLLSELFDYESISAMFILNTILFCFSIFTTGYFLTKWINKFRNSESNFLLLFINSLLFAIILNFIFSLPLPLIIISLLLIFPCFFLSFTLATENNKLILNYLLNGISLYYSSFLRSTGIYLLSVFFCVMFFLLNTWGLSEIYLQLLYINLPFSDPIKQDIYTVYQCSIVTLTMCISIAILLVSYTITYFSLIEVKTAKNLLEKIKNVF